MGDVKTHQGSCHCGAVTYEVETDLSQVIECNCTHCYRKGLLLTFVTPDAFRLKSGEGELVEYLFNKRVIRHQFCRTCGVETFGWGVDPKGQETIAINLRTLTDVEPFSLEATYRFDGLHKA